MTDVIIKSQETRTGVRFRILRDGKYLFAEVPFQNYFYIKFVDYEQNENEFLTKWNRNLISKCEVVGQFVKIYLSNNFMRTQIKDWWEERCKTYEADIKANKNFLLDKNIKLYNEEIPYCFFDIETDDRLPMKKDERGLVMSNGQRILSCSFYDYKGVSCVYDLKAENDESEKALLTAIIQKLAQYGIIAGWNSVRFDMPYIKQRCDALGIGYKILDYVNHLDYMEIFKKYERKTLKKYSLSFVSMYVLKRDKVDQKKGKGAIYDTWQSDREHLKKYNLEDSKLLYDINKERLFIEVSMHRANNATCHPQSTMNGSDSGDYYLMKRYRRKSFIMPSKPTRAEVEERKKRGKIGGGFTNCFCPGFFRNARVWDFKSMYPSVVNTWGISPETYVASVNKVEGNDYSQYFITPCNFDTKFHPYRLYKKEKGIFPEAAKELIAERDKIKYRLTPELKKSDPILYRRLYLEQYALKVDANTYFYGLLSFPPGRYFNWEVADSVTSSCQAMIKECYNKLGEWSCTVLGGDTDSTFALLGDNVTVEKVDQLFREFFDEWVKQWNIEEHSLVFEYEKNFETFLFVKKKNYAYKMYNEITIVGMEAIKSDSAVVGAKMQEEFIHAILNDNYKEEEWREKINNINNRVFNQQLTTAELTLIKALTKMPEDYKGNIIDGKTGQPKIKADGSVQMKSIPAHVKLAERLINKGIDLYPGSKIEFIVVKQKPILALSPEEYEAKSGVYQIKSRKKGIINFEFSGHYDAEYYWLRSIKPLIKVVNAYYSKLPEWDWAITNSQMKKIIEKDDDSTED